MGISNPLGVLLSIVETEVFVGACSNVFTNLDLSAVVGAGPALVVIKVENREAGAQNYFFRSDGEVELVQSISGNGTGTIQAGQFLDFLTRTSPLGIIEWRGSNDAQAVTIDVIAYVRDP